MKKIVFLVLSLCVAIGMAAQERQDFKKGMYGIDHEKKIVVATGKLPKGTKSFKKTD